MIYGKKFNIVIVNCCLCENKWFSVQEADLAIAPLTITSSREKVVAFTSPFLTQGISIMIRRPATQRPGAFSFMEPFSGEVSLKVHKTPFRKAEIQIFAFDRLFSHQRPSNKSNIYAVRAVK